MHLSLEGKRALITGGSQGLGKAMAMAFAAAGAEVMICARGAEPLAETSALITAETGGNVHTFSADVSTAAGCDAVYGAAVDRMGSVDVLVNNAGRATRGPFESLTDIAWQDDLDLKIFAAIRLCRHVLPGMRAGGWGRILNVVSTGGKTPNAGGAPTDVWRAAGIALTKSLAGEVAKHGITVNALCTGKIMSEQWPRMHARQAPDIPFEEFAARVGKTIPAGRMGEAGEFAAMALFLASPAASYVTGTAINVDGGFCPVP